MGERASRDGNLRLGEVRRPRSDPRRSGAEAVDTSLPKPIMLLPRQSSPIIDCLTWLWKASFLLPLVLVAGHGRTAEIPRAEPFRGVMLAAAQADAEALADYRKEAIRAVALALEGDPDESAAAGRILSAGLDLVFFDQAFKRLHHFLVVRGSVHTASSRNAMHLNALWLFGSGNSPSSPFDDVAF